MSFYKVSKSCQIPNLGEIYERFFGRTTNGSFVEVGGYDGESFSNTSCLADAGWRGLYVEPVPAFARACAARHKNNYVLVAQLAVGEPGSVTLHLGGTLTTMKERHVDAYKNIEWARGHHKGEKIVVKTVRLDDLLRRARISSSFEVLVVDVEGAEPDVFATFDLAQWGPKMMIVELEDNHNSFRKYTDIVDAIRELRGRILGTGYDEIFRDKINTIFVRSDLCR